MQVFQSICLYETEFYEKWMGTLIYLTKQMLTTILRAFQLSDTKVHNSSVSSSHIVFVQ